MATIHMRYTGEVNAGRLATKFDGLVPIAFGDIDYTPTFRCDNGHRSGGPSFATEHDANEYGVNHDGDPCWQCEVRR